jgi:hypothetical protein
LASTYATAASKYLLRQDAQAVAVAQSAFEAMGGAKAVLGYQDSLAAGTVTIYSGNNPVSYPITMKSKGLRETRVELQMEKGTNVRIVCQGQGAILRPDGRVKALDLNNTFYEHVTYLPLLSVLADYDGGNVNLIYQGTADVQGQTEDVIEIDFVPDLSPTGGPVFAAKSRTLFFVNQSTELIDKTQRATFFEGDPLNTFNEETYYTDYRSVNGVLVPFHQVVYIDGKVDTDLMFTSINFNVGLSDSDFVVPQAR